MKRLLKIIPALLLLPFITSAADGGEKIANFSGVRGLLNAFEDIVNTMIVPTIFTIAFLVFLFGIFQTFILGASDEGKQKEGKTLMLYSIIGFVLMVSIWGIVNIFADGLNLNDDSGIPTPRTQIIP